MHRLSNKPSTSNDLSDQNSLKRAPALGHFEGYSFGIKKS